MPGTIAWMDEETNLRNSARWRLAVWGLRVMGPGLAVVAAGLIILGSSTAAGQAILIVGIGVYLFGVVLSFVEVNRAYGKVQSPRPNYAQVHQTLWHDATHARS